MKNRFPEFYNELNFEKLWKTCTFVFDTNILLNLYSFSKDDYKEFINILDDISSRLWMPHQIGWEYQKNRYSGGIDNAINKHNTLKGLIKNSDRPFKDIKKFITENSITELQVDCVDLDLINKCLKEIGISIEKMSSGVTDFDNSNDTIRDKLDFLYNGKVGAEYPIQRLKELYNEATFRYTNNIPPGFKDKNKKNGNHFGDFILWNQMMDYARDNNNSIIFITEDIKGDWWLNKKPHPYLIKEFMSTGQDFYMYNFSDFLTQAKTYLKAKIKQETINKVKDTEKLQDLTDKLRSDEKSPQKMELLALELLAKEPELFKKLINPGYTLTHDDTVLLLNVLFKEPELFKKIMINSGQDFTEDDQAIFDIVSKEPNLIDMLADEVKFDNNAENNDSKPVKEKEMIQLKKKNHNKHGKKSKKSKRMKRK